MRMRRWGQMLAVVSAALVVSTVAAAQEAGPAAAAAGPVRTEGAQPAVDPGNAAWVWDGHSWGLGSQQGVPAYAVDLTSDTPGVGYRVYQAKARPGRDAPYVSCPGPCRVVLPRGEYRFVVTETDVTLSGSRMITINAPSTIQFDPDTRDKRSAGLTLGIAGPVVMLVGLVVALASSCNGGCDGSSSSREHVAWTGIGMMAAGLTATPVGWVMFGTSFKPEYEVLRAPVWSSHRSSGWSVGLAPSMTGAGLTGQLRF